MKATILALAITLVFTPFSAFAYMPNATGTTVVQEAKSADVCVDKATVIYVMKQQLTAREYKKWRTAQIKAEIKALNDERKAL